MAFTEDSYTESIGITGDLSVDNIKIDGINIGHKDDTDLLSLVSGQLTVSGNLITNGNLTITGNVISSGNYNGNVNGDLSGDVTGDLTGNVLTAAQTNITSLGTLTGLDVTGQSNFTVTNDDTSGFTILNSNGSGYKLLTYSALGPFFELIENTSNSGGYPYITTKKPNNTGFATQPIAITQHKYENDSSTERTFVQIQALSTDDTHNAEKGAWRVGIRNGALGAEANTRLQVDTNGITATGRVKASTFEAVSQTPWQVTNHSVDRVFDADSTSTEELADVLGTLINDLITLGLIKAL